MKGRLEILMKKLNKKNRNLLLIMAGILLVVLTTGGLIAKYTTQNKREAQMISDEFHISSNYLERIEDTNENPNVINVGGWGADRNLEIKLYNHQKENLALVTAKDISYKINLGTNPSGWEIDEVVNNNGDTVEATTDEIYTLPGDGENRVTHTIILKNEATTDDGELSPVTVTVEAVEPYMEKLSATFQMVPLVEPKYEIEDKGNYCLITIHTNDYYDNIDVKWDSAKFSPDNTSVISASWKDSTKDNDGKSFETFPADPYRTYELIFVKKTNERFEKSGVGNIITLY